MATRIALVTGANRGIGFEISRRLALDGMFVFMGARNLERGQEAAAALLNLQLPVQAVELDVTSPQAIARVVDTIVQRFGRIDVLVNNAGVIVPDDDDISRISLDCISSNLATHCIGPLQLLQIVTPLMKQHRYGRVVNLSSSWGSLTYMGDPTAAFGGTQAPGYRMAKAALNVVTIQFARQLRDDNVLINSACPGWVRTRMGTDAAPLDVAQGADTPVWLATLPDGGVSGGFFRDRRPIPW